MDKQQQLRYAGMNVMAGKQRVTNVDIDLSSIDPDYIGKFKFHHPTVMERMQIGVLKAQMLQGLEGRVDVLTDNIAHMSATLEVVLDHAPEWFNAGAIYDYEVLDAVYEEYAKWLATFRRGSKKPDDAGNSQGATE